METGPETFFVFRLLKFKLMSLACIHIFLACLARKPLHFVKLLNSAARYVSDHIADKVSVSCVGNLTAGCTKRYICSWSSVHNRTEHPVF
ncbi:hypothetical protein AHF37_10721 [Paragonimus kellicotti]|nr:hypothetical protein AHF37_10721 [Paragonimus kellicotti]